jgi:phosphoglycolate phosphatase
MKAVFFDLDGTLVDSVPDLAFAIDAMLVAMAYRAAGEDNVRLWVGNGARRLVLRALANARQCAESAVDYRELSSAHALFLEHYSKSASQRTRVYPGVVQTLTALKNRGLRMAIITNKPQQFTPHLLQVLGLSSFFDMVVCGDTLPVQKPDPAALFYVMEKWQLQPADCVMVGDSRNDIEAANAAGVRSVCVSYGYNHGEDTRMLPATWHVGRFSELLHCFEG